MPTVSTHVLDAAGGGAVSGVLVELHDAAGTFVAGATTGPDGRVPSLGPDMPAGTYRLSWHVGGAFLDGLSVVLNLDEERHYHVPLLASAASAVTYLGV